MFKDLRFKAFLLNENRAYLGQRIGDILTALQDLDENSEGMGARQLIRASEGIVNQMRRILHTHWPQSERVTLQKLQKCAVAIMKAIEEKDTLESVIKASVEVLQQTTSNMEMPINNLASPEGKESLGDAPKSTGDPQGKPQKGEFPPPPKPPQQQLQQMPTDPMAAQGA